MTAENVYISVDIEGISGVVATTQGELGNYEYERARRLMTQEANAAIEGARAAGAQHIVVNDAHGPMRNLLIEELHGGVELITGSPKPLSMMQGVDASFDLALFVGYHARAGTTYAVIDHTFSGTIADVQINGVRVGEIGLNSYLAGTFGVPVGLVTGDQHTCAEAHDLLGDEVLTVQVKESYARYAARCLHPQEARSRIRSAAEQACANPEAFTPLGPDTPVTLRISFYSTAYVDMAELIPGSRRLNARTLEFQHDDYATVYKVIRAMVKLSSDLNR